MSYVDRTQKGSFRGVEFFTESSTTTFGRKQAVYALPFEDRGVAVVDLGRAPRTFRIKAFLIGDNYDVQRDQLIDALEAPGHGLLVHWKHGRVNVVIRGDVSITESTRDGGMAEIDFDCIEARQEATPVSADTAAASISAARNLRSVAGEQFGERFSVDGVPDFVAESNLAVLDEVIDELTDINQLIGAVLEVPSHFAAQIDAISRQTSALINTPTLLYNTIDATIASVMQSISRVAGTSRRGLGNLDQVIGLSAALGADTAVPRRGTPTRDVERENRAQLLIAMRASALSSAAEAAAELEFASADEANGILQTLAAALGDLSDSTIDDIEPPAETFDAIRDLLGAITAHLSEVAGNLSELTTYTPADTIPAVVLAFELYGDAERAEELLARNDAIVHPLMVPGGVALEILTP
jgi:prophage DNA circulation protein